MKLEQLYVFCAVADSGSIRKASKNLNFTPQAISKLMIQFEEELNVRLYDRSRTGIVLTHKGEEVYIRARKIINEIESFNSYFNLKNTSVPNKNASPVTIEVCSSMETVFSGAINAILAEEKFSNVSVQIYKQSTSDIETNIIKKSYADKTSDILVLAVETERLSVFRNASSKTHSCYGLFTNYLRLQVPVSDPLTKYDKIPFETLVDLPMYLYSGNPREESLTEKYLEKIGYKLNNVSRSSNFETISQIAYNLKKYCFVGYPSVEFRPMANVVYMPLEVDISNELLMFVKKYDAQKRPFLEAIIEYMDEYFDLKKMW